MKRSLASILEDRRVLLDRCRQKFGPTLDVRVSALVAAYESWKARGGNPRVFVATDWRTWDLLLDFLGYEVLNVTVEEEPASPVAAAELWLARFRDEDPETTAVIEGLLQLVPKKHRKKSITATPKPTALLIPMIQLTTPEDDDE